MENQSQVMRNVTTIAKNIKQVDLSAQIDRLFQTLDIHVKYKQNYLINAQLLQKLSKYILLRIQYIQKDAIAQAELVKLHYQIRQSIKYSQFVRSNKERSSSEQFLYNIITLIELAANLLQRYTHQTAALSREELFITLVYIVTNKLISLKCYFVLRLKMRRTREERISNKSFKSRNMYKMESITMGRILEQQDLFEDFAYSLKTTLYNTSNHKSQKNNQEFHKSKITKYSPSFKRPKTPIIYHQKSNTQNLTPQMVKHCKNKRISLQRKCQKQEKCREVEQILHSIKFKKYSHIWRQDKAYNDESQSFDSFKVGLRAHV